jgi:hypothetical protein
MIHDLIPLVTALLWPATILILVCWFRKGIKALIASVVEAKIGNSVFLKFGQAQSDITIETLPNPATKQISAPSGVEWENVANLFWLGNDLEWTGQTVLRGAPRERVHHGLKKCNHHCSELGLTDSVPGKQLTLLKSQVEGMSEAALDRQWRNAFSEKILGVVRGFDILVREQQPNFRPDPEL